MLDNKKYWNENIKDQVIGGIIVGAIFAIIAWVKSIYEDVSFLESVKRISQYLFSTIEINVWVLLIGIFLTVGIVLFLFKKFSAAGRIKKEGKAKQVELKEYPRTGQISTVIFSSRLSSAFPGHRGFQWYEGKNAVNRLEKFFEQPLIFKPISKEASATPFWWFRGLRSMYIDNFKKLSNRKILLGIKELKVKRIGVYVSELYYKSFIYLEAEGEQQTGIYKLLNKNIEDQIDSIGFAREEFGIFGNTKISRDHFDDGATVINGKIVETHEAELRTRYLSDYNFIIAAHDSPLNSHLFEKETEEYFKGILKGTITEEVFLNKIKSLGGVNDSFPRRLISNSEYNDVDKKTYERLIELLPSNNVMLFIEQNGFVGGSFPDIIMEYIDLFLIESEYPEFEFVDTDLEGLRSELTILMRELDDLICCYTFGAGSGKQGIPREWEETQPERLSLAISEFSSLTPKVYSAYESLVKLARRKLYSN